MINFLKYFSQILMDFAQIFFFQVHFQALVKQFEILS